MGIKAGWDEDRLFDVSSVCLDELASPPPTPVAGQIELYARANRIYKKDSTGTERIVGDQDADEVNIDTAITDNNAVGDNVQEFIDKICAPTNSQKATYLGDGELDFIEIFSVSTQITANRIARVDFTYDANINPITEVWKHFDTADGTTVLKTFTLTHTWVGDDYDKTTSATT